jgi:very-short-patch-repair endonuclease
VESPFVGAPFVGAEALALGLVDKYALRSRFRPIYPGVYLPPGLTPDFRQRAEAAWLWSHRDGVLSGLTAARLYGAKWIDEALPIELNWSNGRPPPGIRIFKDQLADGERSLHAGLPVTTVARTAYDIGRRGRLGDAVARLDALGNAAAFAAESVEELAHTHRGARGIRHLRMALALYDPGAQSPQETWLRLLIMGAGFPKPQTQIPVRAGRRTYYLDMGWPEFRIAVEYDGDHHRTDRSQFNRDIVRLEELVALGWIIIRIAARTPREEVVARLRRALATASKVH